MKTSRLPTLQEIEELTAFLPELYAGGFSPITSWSGGEKQKDGSITMPYPSYHKTVEEFFRVAARECWLDFEYDPEQAGKMLRDEKLIKTASLSEIKTMLTFCVRGERFSDGPSGAMIEEGHIRRLLERTNEIKIGVITLRCQTLRIKTMEYSELIAARYSVRAYRPDPVEDEKLQAVLEAARLAPTAANRQPFQLVVMHTAGREEEIGKIYRRPWFVQAPLVIAVCAISSQAWVREGDRFNSRMIDAAIVADHLILAAANLGLGTCWIAAFNVEAARSVLRLPADAEPVIFTPLGYPADLPGPKSRKPLADLVRYEHW